jgi:large subunit ribosomal protein L24
VEVVVGDASGSRGRIIRVISEKRRVVVEGINMVWKHLRPSRQRPRGGRLEIEAAIDASNVMLICPNKACKRYDKTVRTRTILRQDGTRTRACAKCGAEIPKAE